MRILGGKPLVAHAVDAAQESGVFSAIYVTSDDPAVLALAGKCGAVPHQRNEALAQDDALMADVVADLATHPDLSLRGSNDAFVLLQPTSPLRSGAHIHDCVMEFLSGDWASAVSVCELEHPPQKSLVIRNGTMAPLFDAVSLNANRQTLEKAYRQNGAIWVVRWDAFLATRSFVVDPVMPFVMDEADSIDIDTEADLARAQTAIEANPN